MIAAQALTGNAEHPEKSCIFIQSMVPELGSI